MDVSLQQTFRKGRKRSVLAEGIVSVLRRVGWAAVAEGASRQKVIRTEFGLPGTQGLSKNLTFYSEAVGAPGWFCKQEGC